MPSCGGFVSTKNALTALNSLYIVVSIVLISVGTYAKEASMSISVVASIIVTGVFLFLFRSWVCLGLQNTTKLCSSLPKKIVAAGWKASSNSTRFDAEHTFSCCGLATWNDLAYNCDQHVNYTSGCLDEMTKQSNEALQIAGGIGLFFSFSEILGVWLAMKYRNQKNMLAKPNRYLWFLCCLCACICMFWFLWCAAKGAKGEPHFLDYSSQLINVGVYIIIAPKNLLAE